MASLSFTGLDSSSAPQAQEAAGLDFVIVIAGVIIDDDMAEVRVAPAAGDGSPDFGELAVLVHSQFGPSALPQSFDAGRPLVATVAECGLGVSLHGKPQPSR